MHLLLLFGKFIGNLGNLEYQEMVLSSLTFLINFAINLINRSHYNCKRKKILFSVLKKYLKIIHIILEKNNDLFGTYA